MSPIGVGNRADHVGCVHLLLTLHTTLYADSQDSISQVPAKSPSIFRRLFSEPRPVLPRTDRLADPDEAATAPLSLASGTAARFVSRVVFEPACDHQWSELPPWSPAPLQSR